MRIVMVAMLASGVMTATPEAEAGTITNGWWRIKAVYTNPEFDIINEETARTVETYRTWSGNVKITATIDGIEYSGTGTGSGSTGFDSDDKRYYSNWQSETITGFLDNGSPFVLDTNLRNWGSRQFDPDEILAYQGSVSSLGSIHAGWSYFATTDDTRLYLELGGFWQDSDMPAPIPVPAAGVLMLSAIAGGFGLKLRRRGAGA